MTALLTLQDVDKSFGTRAILRGASLAVSADERVALVGANGAGKSTLLRMVVAEDPADPVHGPDRGLLTRQRGLTLEYVPQEPHLEPTHTVVETLRTGLREHAGLLTRLETLETGLAALTGSALDAALVEQATLHRAIEDSGGWDRDHEIGALHLALRLPPLDAVVGRLSGGERRRVALGRALLRRAELLLLDEPTNHLDAESIDWLATHLRERKGTLLLVTHDRWFLDRVATRIVELDRGQLYSYPGDYTMYLTRRADRLAEENERERRRSSFVRRELDWIRRGPAARTTKQQARIDRFDAAVAAKPGADDKLPGMVSLRLPTGGRLGKTILELDDVGITLGERRLFEHLTLVMKPGDRIGIVGKNGLGKTTLVRAILDELSDTQHLEGKIVVGQNTRISYLDQERAELDDARTVLEEVAGDSSEVILETGPVHVRTFLRMMLFDDRFADTPIGTLSGGERNRVQLARLLRKGGNLIILDEPTNDLDLPTLGVLEEALIEFPACALLVSHDRWFLDRVATAILAFEPAEPGNDGGTSSVVLYEGSYSDYLARRAPPVQAKAAAKPVAAPPSQSPTAKPKKLSFKETQELASIEAAILTAEGEVARREAELADPGIYRTRGAEIASLTTALEIARGEVARLYDRWAELDART